MTLSRILEKDLINDNTEVFIRDQDCHVLAHGSWYQDNVLNYVNRGVESFTWQDDNKIFIDVKDERDCC